MFLSVNSVAVTNEPTTASVVITGLVIVFSMLLFFVILFSIFGKVMDKSSGKNKVKPAKPVKADVQLTAPPKPVASADIDDEIIAVISAAVYSMYSSDGKYPVIRSIKPAVRNGRSNWAMAGIRDNIRSF